MYEIILLGNANFICYNIFDFSIRLKRLFIYFWNFGYLGKFLCGFVLTKNPTLLKNILKHAVHNPALVVHWMPKRCFHVVFVRRDNAIILRTFRFAKKVIGDDSHTLHTISNNTLFGIIFIFGSLKHLLMFCYQINIVVNTWLVFLSSTTSKNSYQNLRT